MSAFWRTVYFLRAVIWMLLQVVLGVVATVFELLTLPIFYFLDPTHRVYQYTVCTIAQMGLYPFITVEVKGAENLPTDACVVVSNHGSFLDPSVCAVALKSINFKCTFRHDLMYVPGIGSCLWMAGHIPVNRRLKDNGLWSGKDTMATSLAWAQRGVPLLAYAEGTRKTVTTEGGSRLGEFKPGPFVTAQRAQVPVVPVTISGARRLFPPGFPQLGFGSVLVTIHPPTPPPAPSEDKAEAVRLVEEVKEAVRRTIDSALRSPEDNLPVAKAGKEDKEKDH